MKSECDAAITKMYVMSDFCIKLIQLQLGPCVSQKIATTHHKMISGHIWMPYLTL